MADITDPVYLKFVNERLRPMCERLRDIDLEIQDILTAWNGWVKQTVTANVASDPVADGRDAEGVTRLTKNDVKVAVDVFVLVEAAISSLATNRDEINYPTVRNPRIS